MDIITEAKRQVFLTGRLDFPDRQKLWRALGEAEYDENGYAVRTKGLIKRVKLAKTCVKRVLPIWDICRKGDRRPFYMLKLVDAYFRDEITKERLKQLLHTGMIDEFSAFVHAIVWGNYFTYGSLELLAARVIQMALYDDRNLNRNKRDEDIVEIEETDIPYYVYNIYYRHNPYDKRKKEIEEIEEEQKYWLWYINEVADLLEETEFEYSIF